MNRITRFCSLLALIAVISLGATAQVALYNQPTPGAGPNQYAPSSFTADLCLTTQSVASCLASPVAVFTDNAGTALTSPFALQSSGYTRFFAPPGSYNILYINAQAGIGNFLFPALVAADVGKSAYQGTTSVGITTTSFTPLIAAASDILIPPPTFAKAGKRVRIHADGVYTTAAASLLNAEVMLCTVSGCGSGTVVAPAGCAIVSTNQANVLANGQFSLDCTLTSTSTVGAAGTFMAKGRFDVQLGAATTAVQSPFADAVTAVSAAVDETVNEFVNIAFKFSTSNASNAAIVHSAYIEVLN